MTRYLHVMRHSLGKSSFFVWLLVVAAFHSSVSMQAQTPQVLPYSWHINGEVRAIEQDGNNLYLGGMFTMIGPLYERAQTFNTTTGTAQWAHNMGVNGDLRVSIPDGAGGWYIGGNFTSVLGQTRRCLARINADGTLNSWNPDVSSAWAYVFSLAVSGSTVYVGGDFTTIGGVSRNNFAAVDATTGAVGSLDLNANASVRAILVRGTVLHIGGWFTSIGGTTRNYVASVDLTTGNLTTWNPNADRAVNTFTLNGTTIYIGGDFTFIAGSTRNRAAAMDANTGVLSAWNPNTTGSVFSILLSGSTIFLGGAFATVGGTSRPYLAQVNNTTGALTAWTPGGSLNIGLIYSLGISGTNIYAAGTYNAAADGSYARYGAASFAISNGALQAWNPMASGRVYTMNISGTTVFLGGDYTVANGTVRNGLAAIDIPTGNLLAWAPACGGAVRTLVKSGSTLYVGGGFTTLGGATRNKAGAVDITTGALSAWNPNVTGNNVNAIGLGSGKIYLGGWFTSVGGTARNYAAAVNATTGALDAAWNPNPNNEINAIVVDGSQVILGGKQTTINGTTRAFLSAVNATNASLNSFAPNVTSMVNCLLKDGNTLYVGGYFPFINGFTRRSLAAFNLTTGALTSWAPSTNNFVWSMAKQGNTIYIGGNFTTVGTEPRNHLAAVYTNGTVASWNPNAGYTGTLQPTTWAVGANASYVFAGGTLSSFAGTYRPFYATLGPAWTMPVTWQQVSATLQNNQVLVKWSTEQEQNTRDFIVQHSTDGRQWNDIGHTAAAGNSNSLQYYSFVHTQAASGINHYRIVQYDLDGRSTQSKVVTVRTGEAVKQAKLLGNVITDGRLLVQMAQAGTVELYQADGKLLLKKQVAAGLQNIDVSNYPKGSYLVKLDNGIEKVMIR